MIHIDAFHESTTIVVDQAEIDRISHQAPMRKIIGNREDITLLYRKSRDFIWDKKIFQVLVVNQSTDGLRVEIAIMNLWKMCKSGESFWLEEYDLDKSKWKKLPANKIAHFPRINVYPVVQHTDYIHSFIYQAVEKIANYYGYLNIKPTIYSDKKTLTKEFILKILSLYLKKVIGKENLDIKAKILRTHFYQHFYDKAIVKGLMSVNYRYVGFQSYFTCLMLKHDFFRVLTERKNLLPILLKVNPSHWSRLDLFSKKNWCQGNGKSLCGKKQFGIDKPFAHFENASVFRWLFNQKITVIKAWLFHRQVQHLSIVKKAAESTSSQSSTYALYALVRHIQNLQFIHNTNFESNLHFLFRAFLNESNQVWKNEGYSALRKWVVFNSHKMTSIYDYLISEESKNAVNKKSTWQSIQSKSDEWHEHKHKELIANQTRVLVNKVKLEWVSLIQEIDINQIVFTALDTYQKLHQESMDMHHCVVDYVHGCLSDNYRVFHIDDGSGNKATLGIFLGRVELSKTEPSWHINQIQAECNEMTTKEIMQACDLLLQEYNRLWLHAIRDQAIDLR
jgi:PcfJ-like protein